MELRDNVHIASRQEESEAFPVLPSDNADDRIFMNYSMSIYRNTILQGFIVRR